MSELLVTREGPVTTLTLNRPDKANALNASLVEALHEAVNQAAAYAPRLIVLRGEGRNFCAGFDFGGFEEASVAELCWRFVRIEQLLQWFHHAPCATLALAQGGCFGAGADLFAVCDERVCAPETRVRMPGWKFGLALGTRRLSARIGQANARRVLEAAAVVDAAEAQRLGLATQVAEPAAWGPQVARSEALAQSLTAEAQARLHGLTLADTRAADMAALVESLTAGDLKARIRAFRAL
ncbi:MAG TPA: enoyl-CoA hydratase/isomerase family protein [Burkholderiales bacterium]|jgi:enoyl-CoA hydratase/carnithine racemase